MHAPPWTAERKVRALHRGPHKFSQGEREFVSEEMADFCRQGYWLVPQDIVADWPKLRILPLGVVPQQDQMPRLIADYSFSNVNSETAPLAPHEGMHQFGRALQCVVLLIIVHANRRYDPVHMAKIDIADGCFLSRLATDRRCAKARSRASNSSPFAPPGCLSVVTATTNGMDPVAALFCSPHCNRVRSG